MPLLEDSLHVLVRGLYGARLPGHFVAARRALQGAGLRTQIARTDPVGSIDANVAQLAALFRSLAGNGTPFVILAHSRGGLESVLALASLRTPMPSLGAIVLCQTARGASPALDDILDANRWGSRLWRLAIRATGGLPACREISDPATGRRAVALDAFVSSLPAISVATWSAHPSASLEAQHRRMHRRVPGVAHDGLFLTQDLIWPTARQILLAEVDHSQPGIGGGGFDCGRFWLSLASVAAVASVEARSRHQRSSAGSDASSAAGYR